ncbi:MAG: GIY-YIG nuclease family protein [Alphaproteobacteria bacterium]|nr:GIY-YIG nuclease family protein [Alphaproteobacteria bacterium]
MKSYHVYMITNYTNAVLYIGITGDLEKRIYEHKYGLYEGFSKKYNVNKLVYCEEFMDVNEAIAREKEVKKWRREKKDRLVERMNPQWLDLFEQENGSDSSVSGETFGMTMELKENDKN